MTIEIKVPALGESLTEATVAKWFHAVGESIAIDQPLVELETDKVTVEVNAEVSGTLASIVAGEGSEVVIGALLGTIEEGAAPAVAPQPPPVAAEPTPAPAPAAAPQPAPAIGAAAKPLAPAVRKLVAEHRLDPASIPATGKGGRLTKGDVLAFIDAKQAPQPPPVPAAPQPPTEPAAPQPAAAAQYPPRPAGPREERVRMTRLRRRIAERLKEAQNTAAMLTTFNEVDMTAVIELRGRYKEAFEIKHGVRIGFMSFFVKACVTALREFPAVNGEIDGDDIVYKNHYDIGVAIGAPQGLVVPVVRDADRLGFADIERIIADLGRRARDAKLTIEELQGGTFTITNGGVYGSLSSTPILNPPQSGVLGMHKIQQRPMVIEDGTIAARPMMHLALSYDHRIVDGREAVSFLVRIKECIEDPQRIMLDT